MHSVAPREPQIADDHRLVEALRRGDEDAFADLVGRYSSSLLRLALDFVRTRSVAEEVVQETWLAVLTGIDRFEGRSSLKTWIFRILVSEGNQRVLLHRGRSKLRAALERYMEE